MKRPPDTGRFHIWMGGPSQTERHAAMTSHTQLPDNPLSLPQGAPSPTTGRLADIAASLRRPDPVGSHEKIDRLLRAMAEKDTAFRKETSKNAGDIAVAIDRIMRWIGVTESRLAALAVPETETDTVQPAMNPAMNIAGMEMALSALEKRLANLERRVEALRSGPEVPETGAEERQPEFRAPETEPHTEKAPGRYFDLVANQIEALEDELRRKIPPTAETGRAKVKERVLSEHDISDTIPRTASGGKTI